MQLAGLSQVSDNELRRLLRAIHRDELPFPITRAGLIGGKFGNLEAELDPIIGRDKESARAMVTAVLAERARTGSARRAAATQLIWKGPQVPGTGAREPFEVVQELIATAEREILIAGFGTEGGRALWRTLHAAMVGRGLDATVALATAARLRDATAFVEDSWPYRDVRPGFYAAPADPGAGQPALRIAGPCVIVDEQRAAVWTGGFDPEAEPDRVQAGILVDDPTFAAMLARQWKLLIADKVLRPL